MSEDQNIWTKSTRLIWGPHVGRNILMFKAKYNILQYNHIAMSVGKKSKQCAAESRQRHLAKTPSKTAAEKMIKIRDK